jgi:phosphoglycolate phosphatase
MPRRLVLFDIDGTLITDGGTARDSFSSSLRSVYGYEGDLSRYDFSGRTDPEIAAMVLRDAGWDEAAIQERMLSLWAAYLAGLEARAHAARVRPLAGIERLIERLSRMAEVTLALLTGNIEPGARLKLAPPDLNRYFPFGAFGSDSPRRSDLPPIAVRRAAESAGQQFSKRDVVIIGDSIYDIRCGVPHEATTIAIASGKTPGDKLRAENPHHFFESAEDAAGIIAAILGPASS